MFEFLFCSKINFFRIKFSIIKNDFRIQDFKEVFLVYLLSSAFQFTKFW